MYKRTRLYNVIFPVWMLTLFPQMWLIAIPGNFVIDSIVLIILMFILKVECKKSFYIKNIFKVFALGFAADMISALTLFLITMYTPVSNYVVMADEWFLTIPALLFASLLIFVFNYFISFKKHEKSIRLKMALTFAIATAPYTFLIPSSILY